MDQVRIDKWLWAEQFVRFEEVRKLKARLR